MKLKLMLATCIICSISFGACDIFQKKKEDNTRRNLGLLLFLGSTNTTAECTGASGMVICIPKGIAE